MIICQHCLISWVVGRWMVNTPALLDFLRGWSVDGKYASTSRCLVSEWRNENVFIYIAHKKLPRETLLLSVSRNPCWWCRWQDRRPDWEIYIGSCWTAGWRASPVSRFASFLLRKVVNWPWTWSWFVLYKLSWEVIKQQSFHISCPGSWFLFSKFTYK